MFAIGLMSGTSMDGVDAAIIETNGVEQLTLHDTLHVPYENALREALTEAGQGRGDRDALGIAITQIHIAAVEALLAKSAAARDAVELIGFHGHTVRHEPERGITVQIGCGALLAQALNIAVVADFRTSDVALGGQGAPLAPIYHWGLAQSLLSDLPKPLAIVNLGGVANVTYVTDAPEGMVAFDTGPANMLLDQWVQSHGAGDYDDGGRIASQGRTHNYALSQMLDNLYYKKLPPKSLDRYDLSVDAVQGLSLEDGAATLTALTAQTVADALDKLPNPPQLCLICGGGARNPVLLRALQSRISAVASLDEYGIDPDFVEAQAFAYMAVRALKRLPISFAGTTGVSRAAVGGAFYQV